METPLNKYASEANVGRATCEVTGNEDTRIQLELINHALAELQVEHKEREGRKRPRIGFIKAED